MNVEGSFALQAARPRGEATRMAAVLMLAGASLILVTVLLPPGAVRSDGLILGLGGLVALCGLLLLRAREASDVALGFVAALGTIVITLGTYEAGLFGVGSDDNEILYLWVCLYCFYFLSLPHALAQLGIVGLSYGTLLVLEAPGDTVLPRWLTTMTTLLVAGLVIWRLRGSLEGTMNELFQRSRHDPLTGVLNRRGLEERTAIEFAHARRSGSPVSVIAADVDGFKALNDSLGHPAGDEVLRRVAMALDQETRDIDAVGRMGGDEFAILLPGASSEHARAVADRLRSVSRRALAELGLSSTVSFGMATITKPANFSFDALWSSADAALYVAKSARGHPVEAERGSIATPTPLPSR